jgi:hypothetical protein
MFVAFLSTRAFWPTSNHKRSSRAETNQLREPVAVA